MILNMTHCLIISLIFSVGFMTPVFAVTDAEIEVLEKQLQQQEVEEKQQAEAKRKAEQKRKVEVEIERKRLAEQKRVEDEKRKAEEARLAELERKSQEKEAKKRAEEEEKKEKYNLLIAEAEQGLNNKDKELALRFYKEALSIIPDDPIANTGIHEAEKLKHKLCYEVLGSWLHGGKLNFDLKGDGTFVSAHIGKSTWKCTDPENRTIELKSVVGPMTAVLSTDGQCLHATLWGSASVFNRSGHICK